MSRRALGRQWDEHASSELQPSYDTERARRAIGDWRGIPGWDEAPVSEVEVRKLKPSQRFLFKDQHDSVREATTELPPVKVVRVGKTHYVVDGHHRWDAAREAGRKTIQAKVIDRG